MHVPEGLAWLRSIPGGAVWLDALPSRVTALADLWDLEVGQPFAGSTVSWVAPARRGDQAVVLKVQWPHPECENEAAALRAWADSLVSSWDSADRPCERRLVDAARSLITDLAPTQGEQVLIHQDLHGENVLAAQRSPWLAIDPKPLVGEREFSVAPIVRAFELGHSERAVHARLEGLCAALAWIAIGPVVGPSPRRWLGASRRHTWPCTTPRSAGSWTPEHEGQQASLRQRARSSNS